MSLDGERIADRVPQLRTPLSLALRAFAPGTCVETLKTLPNHANAIPANTPLPGQQNLVRPKLCMPLLALETRPPVATQVLMPDNIAVFTPGSAILPNHIIKDPHSFSVTLPNERTFTADYIDFNPTALKTLGS